MTGEDQVMGNGDRELYSTNSATEQQQIDEQLEEDHPEALDFISHQPPAIEKIPGILESREELKITAGNR